MNSIVCPDKNANKSTNPKPVNRLYFRYSPNSHPLIHSTRLWPSTHICLCMRCDVWFRAMRSFDFTTLINIDSFSNNIIYLFIGISIILCNHRIAKQTLEVPIGYPMSIWVYFGCSHVSSIAAATHIAILLCGIEIVGRATPIRTTIKWNNSFWRMAAYGQLVWDARDSSHLRIWKL